MADKTEQATSSTSGISEDISKWQPYWDENYKRYYWSDGHESVIFCFILLFLLTEILFFLRYGKHRMVVLNHHHLNLDHFQILNNNNNNSIHLVNMLYQ